MSVYVDDMKASFRPSHVAGRTYVMSHLWADSREELLAFVVKIGVDPKWIQEPPKASWVHFDITQSKKKLALKAGAILTDRYGPIEHVARLKGDEKKLATIAQLRARNKETEPCLFDVHSTT